MAEVSIIICASQRGSLLENTISSCINQTYHDCEVLLVGNAVNGAEAGIKEQSESKLIRFVHSEIQSAAAAWNAGIRASTGRYIQFVQSGDLLHQQKIDIQAEILNNDPELDMCYCYEEIYRKTPGDLKILWNTSELPFHLDRFLWQDPVWSAAAPLWRSASLDRIGLRDEALKSGSEFEFNVRALCSQISYFLVPNILQHVMEEESHKQFFELPDVQESKRLALVAAYDRIVSSQLLTSERADAISALLLLSAQEAFQSGSKKAAVESAFVASQYSRGGLMKLVARWIHLGFSNFIFRYSLGPIARRLLMRRWSEKRGTWKRSNSNQIISPDTPVSIHSIPDYTSLAASRRPFASVIIPTYKRFQSLNLTLQDVSCQNVPKEDFEIIVVDNGCSEETRNVVEKVKAEHQVEIEYVPEPAPGAHNARHTGARKAKGEILVFLDDDMRVNRLWLAAYIKEFKRHPGMIAAGGQIRGNWEIPPEPWIINLIEGGKFFPPFGLLSRGNKFLLSPDGYFFSGNMAVSAKVLFEVGGFNPDQLKEIVMGDGETGLHKKLWKKGLHIGYVPDAVSDHFIPSTKMNLDYLLKWSKNWGISSAYGEYSKKSFTTSSLVFDAVRRLLRHIPYWFVIQFGVRRKLDSVSVHRQMYAVCIFERIRFISRLIFNKSYRTFVRHEDWLNHPLNARQ